MKLFRITKKNNFYDLKVGGGVTLNSKPLLSIPVGFICLLSCETSPAELFGGVWERISQGRAIYGAGSLNGIEYVANSTKEAGLPNINGHFELYGSDTGRPYMTFSGAFYSYGTETGNHRLQGLTSGNSATKHKGANFNASRCSSLFGKSDTVQPNAYICYIWKKIE